MGVKWQMNFYQIGRIEQSYKLALFFFLFFLPSITVNLTSDRFRKGRCRVADFVGLVDFDFSRFLDCFAAFK